MSRWKGLLAVGGTITIVVFAGNTTEAQGLKPAPVAEHMDDVTQLVYRNGATSTGPACGPVCSALWLEEHRPIPGQPSSAAMWAELESLLESAGVAPSLDAAVAGAGVIAAAGGTFYLGWEIGGVVRRVLGLDKPGPPPVVSNSWPVTGYAWSTGSNQFWSGSNGLFVPRGWMAKTTLGNRWSEYTTTGTPNGACTQHVLPDIPAGWAMEHWYSHTCISGGANLVFNLAGLYARADGVIHAPEDYNGQPLDRRAAGPADPGTATVKSRINTELDSGRYPTLTAWLAHQFDPRCYPDPFSSTVVVPGILENESVSSYQACLQTLGLESLVYTLPETSLDTGNGDVVETTPEGDESVEPGTTVEIAANPSFDRISKGDPRCDVDGGAGNGDPGDAPPDGTSYPQYQLVRNSPYPGIDMMSAPPVPIGIPLRWGTQRWGWRHILQKHPYSAADEAQTAQALATDTIPTPSFPSTNQWIFHLLYEMPSGTGGTLTCLRSVSVEYFVDPHALSIGGIRGVQNSFTGLYLGGLP